MNGGAGRGGVGHLGEREQFEDYDWSARYGAGWEMFERQTSRPGAKVARGNYDRRQGLRWKKWRCKMGCDGIADEPETRVCIGVRSGTGLWGWRGSKRQPERLAVCGKVVSGQFCPPTTTQPWRTAPIRRLD